MAYAEYMRFAMIDDIFAELKDESSTFSLNESLSFPACARNI